MLISHLRRLGQLFCTMAIAISPSVLSAELILGYGFDGDLRHHGIVTGNAEMYVKGAQSEPTSIAGQYGQALHFSSQATVAIPFKLDHADYPQVTVTAWVKQDNSQGSASRSVFSSGADAGISMGINGGSLAAKAGRTGVKMSERMPSGEWVFIAAVVDTANGWARLHENHKVEYIRDIDTTTSEPKKFENPKTPSLERQPYLFVGARQFKTWQRTDRPLGIDDVQVYAGLLTLEQVQKVRSATGGKRPITQGAITRPRPGGAIAPGTLPPELLDPEAQIGNSVSNARPGLDSADRTLSQQNLSGAPQNEGAGDPCDAHEHCNNGTYCALDRTCHPKDHAPLK